MREANDAEQPRSRIVFLSRDPVFHQQSGSTTYASGILELLLRHGAAITLVSTLSASRSPRLFFRLQAPVPAGLVLRYPGYLRVGTVLIRAWHPLAWARALVRAGSRRRSLRLPSRLLRWMYGPALCSDAWDLSVPAQREVELARSEIVRVQPGTVLANYCIWGDSMGREALGATRTAILMHDLLSDRVRRFDSTGTPLDMPRIEEEQEMRWLSGADVVLAAQEEEAERVADRVSAEVMVAPLVLRPQPLAEHVVVPGRCLFVGSDIDPNRDALRFLLEEIWPLLRREIPGSTLAIAGTVGRCVQAETGYAELAAQGIHVLGRVPDLREEYARAAVCLVPLRLGTGIKIKLVEALGYGKAVVSTRVGVQGMEAWAAQGVVLADSAAQFARCTAEVLRNDGYRRRLQKSALALAEERFGPERPLEPAFHRAFFP